MSLVVLGDDVIVPLENIKFNKRVSPVTQLDLSRCVIDSEIEGTWVHLEPSSLHFSVLHRDRGGGRVEFSECQREVLALTRSKVFYCEFIAINQVSILKILREVSMLHCRVNLEG